jgi:hypothetical protein
MIVEEVGILIHICHTILIKDLKMLCICQHILPKMLMQEHCDSWMRICVEFTSAADNDPDLLWKIVRSDKTRYVLYDTQSKQ